MEVDGCVKETRRKEFVMDNRYENYGNPYGSADPYGNSQNPYGGYDQNGNYNQNNGYNQNAGYNNYNGYYQGGFYNPGGFVTPPAAATEAIRESGKSFPFLFGTICCTLALILTVVTALFNSMGGSDLYDFGDQVNWIADWSFGGSLIGSIPMLIMVIGMWLFLAACASKNPVPSTAGITMVRGAIITYIVILSIVLGLVVIVSAVVIFAGVMAGASANYSYQGFAYQEVLQASMAVALVIVIAVIAILILCLIYYTKMLKTTKVIRNILRTGRITENISMFHIVFNFIVIVFNVISIIFSLVTARYVSSAIPTVIQTLLSMIACISITVTLIMLRSRLRELMMNGLVR